MDIRETEIIDWQGFARGPLAHQKALVTDAIPVLAEESYSR